MIPITNASKSFRNILAKYFDKKVIGLGLAILIAFYIYAIVLAYLEEVARIDNIAMKSLGHKVSAKMTFSGVLSSSGLSLSNLLIISILAVFIPALLTIASARFLIFNESHSGWRRLALILPTVCAFAVLLTQSATALEIPLIFIWSALVPLLLILAVRWILSGFIRPNGTGSD